MDIRGSEGNFLSRDSLMVRYRVHTPGTGNASDGPTPSPATKKLTYQDEGFLSISYEM